MKTLSTLRQKLAFSPGTSRVRHASRPILTFLPHVVLRALLVGVLLWGGGEILGQCNGSHTLYLSGNGTTVWPPASVDPNWSFGSIVVGDNHTLIVPADQTIKFTELGKLEVKSHGKLELYGTLTSCLDYWQGVELRGQVNYFNYDLYDQARFDGIGGKIENAVIGIYAGTMQTIPFFPQIIGSGRIFCEDMKFVNNSISVRIFPYAFFSQNNVIPDFQIAEFKRCTFVVNDSYAVSQVFREHILLERVIGNVNPNFPHNGIYFHDCAFEMQQKIPNSFHRGVLAIASKFHIEGCSFTNLVKGIEVRSTVTPIGSLFLERPYIVSRSKFKDCAMGIHNVSTTGAKIEGNTFLLGDINSAYIGIFNTPVQAASRQVGIYFEGGTNGFTVRYNKFLGKKKHSPVTFGSYWRDLGANNANVVTNNIYRALHCGNFAERFNGDAKKGLTFVCNENHNLVKRFDFFTLDNSSVSDYLSMRMDQGLSIGPSAFAPSLNRFSWMGIDFFAWSNHEYRYYVPPGPPTYPYFPKEYDGITLVTSDKQNNLCGTEFNRFPDDQHLTEEEKAINLSNYYTYKHAYEQALAGYQAAQTEAEKLAALKAMVFPGQEMDVAAYLGYINATSRDSLRAWMQRFENPTGYYMLAGDYVSTGEYSQAEATLNMMPEKFDFSEEELVDHNRVTEIFSLLMAADSSGLSSDALQSLEAYADWEDGQARYLARNILTSHGYFFMPSIADMPLPEEGIGNTDNETGPKLVVSPNPVDFNATFDWSAFDVAGKTVVIEIANQTGGLVQVLEPDASAGSAEWTTEAVSDGILHYRLLINGVEEDAGFFIVNK